jgi:hypothetical protein
LYDEKYKSLPIKERVSRSIQEWVRTFGGDLVYDSWLGHPDLGEDIFEFLKKESPDIFDIVEGYIDGTTKALKEDLPRLPPSKDREKMAELIQSGSKRLSDKIRSFETKSLRETKSIIETAPVEKLAQYLDAIAPYSVEMKEHKDLMLERILEELPKKPYLKKYLQNPNLVRQMYYPASRKTLAQIQLDTLIERAKPTTAKEEIRDIVKEAKALVESQYPEKNPERDDLIERIEKKTNTTLAENAYLKSSRITSDNWVELRDTNPIIANVGLTGDIKSDFDRLEFIDHISGRSDKVPKFVNHHQWTDRTALIDDIKKQFFQKDVISRTIYLQKYLDEKVGILSDSEMKPLLIDRILGDLKKDPMVMELFEAYFGAVPESEKKILLSYIYSSFPDRPPGKNGASIKTILEGMGPPFGAKAGQALRSSGRLSPELNRELDDFFDNASPPRRPEIYGDFEKAFGKDLKPVKNVSELAGSGSLNYGVAADFDSGSAIVRFQREGSEGRAANENRNWQKAIEKLEKSKNPDVRKLAGTLEEARLAAMETLGPGGVELDLSIERGYYPQAKKVYDTDVDETGFRTRAVRPLEVEQAKVAPNMQKKTSVYERIDKDSFSKLPAEKKAAIASKIVKTELKAMFDHGIFDPDGHIGNWLIDKNTNELVRIDYAQLRTVPKAEMQKIKTVLNTLFVPNLSDGDFATIAKNLDGVFEFPQSTKPTAYQLQKFLKEIAAEKDFPNFYEPHQRILAIRNALETKIETFSGEPVRIALRSNARAAISSLGRLLYYRDFIPETRFATLLAKNMGTPILRIAAQTQLLSVRKAVEEKVSQLKLKCPAMLKALLKR